MFFTDYIVEMESKYLAGYSMIFLLGLFLLVNISLIIYGFIYSMNLVVKKFCNGFRSFRLKLDRIKRIE